MNFLLRQPIFPENHSIEKLSREDPFGGRTRRAVTFTLESTSSVERRVEWNFIASYVQPHKINRNHEFGHERNAGQQ
jgi:hypothetical protein